LNSGNPQFPTLIDAHQRRISYLRLSVTDRCNLRCGYCMPAEGVPHVAKSDLLDREQLALLGRVAVEQGIRKIRITGGEPLMRHDIVPLLADLGSLADLERLVLTTNGIRLASLVSDLKEAGVSGVNVSMDSLRDDRFAEITRGGNRRRCWEGIEAALAAGLRTKLNVVVMSQVNEDEVLDFAHLAQAHPLEVRFIEYMPTAGRPDDAHLTVPSDHLLERLSAAFELTPLGHENHAGPARRFTAPGWEGSVGIISPVSCHFCQDCNRIRVTATGMARSCLLHDAGIDLRPWLDQRDAPGLAAALRQVVAIKPEAHGLPCTGWRDEDGPTPFSMSSLGG
jgi:cyclic pyranopterin phosphate synthase